MTSLIQGFFQLINPRQYVEDASESAPSSPRKDKSYLTLYDSYAGLGEVANRVWVPCDLRVYLGGQDLNEQVVQIHGRFCTVPSVEEDDPCLAIDVQRFVVMTNFEVKGGVQSDLRVSVTLLGRVSPPAEAVGNTADKFFTLEVSEYVRGRNKTYAMRFVIFYIAICCF